MGAFKLGKMTFGSLFKKPETVQYPFEQKPHPKGLKGHIVLDVDQCILCGMCDKSCTTNCITVSRAERYWEIQPYQCIQCGYCVTVCPKGCLAMDPNYTSVATVQEPLRLAVPEQVKETKPAAEKKPGAKPEKREVASGQAAANSPDVEAGAEGDMQVRALIGLMDPEKAKIVESVLERR